MSKKAISLSSMEIVILIIVGLIIILSIVSNFGNWGKNIKEGFGSLLDSSSEKTSKDIESAERFVVQQQETKQIKSLINKNGVVAVLE